MFQSIKRLASCISVIGLSLIFTSSGHLVRAQNAAALVAYPISGKMLFHNNTDKIFLVDTATGQLMPIVAVSDSNVGEPIWNSLGTSFAYAEGRTAVNIFDQVTHLTKTIKTFSGREEVLFLPMAWLFEDQHILYRNYWGSYEDGMVKSNYSLDLFQVSTDTITTVAQYSEGDLLTHIPLPSNVSAFQFKQLRDIVPNPQFNEWWIIQMDGIVPGEFISYDDGTYERPVTITYLWNYQTNAMIGLNTLFTDPIDSSSRITWSPDGRYLALATYRLNNSQNWIIYFDFAKATPVIEIIDHAQATEIVYDWLGVSDLLLSLSPAGNLPDSIFYISQIVDGEWKSREFLRFPNAKIPVVFGVDWYITTSPQEQMQISCIFDESLAPQLSLGSVGQVAVFDEAVSYVWAEPDFRSSMTANLLPDMLFEVVDGPACRSGYRWWQIRLDDDAIGWAVEANVTTYFLEPENR